MADCLSCVNISFENLADKIGEQKTKLINWNGYTFYVRPTIEMNEMTKFIESVFAASVDLEKNIAYPEFIDFGVRTSTVNLYTNILLPQNIEERFKILYCTDLFDVVVGNINSAQFDALRNTVFMCAAK